MVKKKKQANTVLPFGQNECSICLEDIGED